ncbi:MULTISPECIES: LysR family transcriptional regulator [unclassified Crossiella]|uniref:LysR family transcriptional regulator n=1 Tax=unclassified Crossiella TaxID=2620835 RepID=UPI00200017FA|nr:MULTISPECIES: LysR family transcriptional regulator [unclassified Crossiella]MCK2244084.1 LysR family transcriptional regulator [Crossiella sp. S99.2]MCK2257058.1 LysR family transcriptional regulator [Crossiella sp. S99.1]
MELRHLEYFVAVAEERHFTRAAERVRVAQSGLSASIKALERELGAPLFVRSTRRVELTEAGRALLVEARRTLVSVAAAKDAVAAVQGVLRGTLSVGMVQCLGVIDAPALLARFHAAHPGVEVRLTQAGGAKLIDGVKAGRLDLALVDQPRPAPDGVSLAHLATEPMLLVCGREHRFARRDKVEWAELADEVFVDFQSDWGARQLTDRVFTTAGMARRVALELNDVHSLLELVGHGLGVAVVPRPMAYKKGFQVAIAELHAPVAPNWEASIALRSGEHVSPSAQAFLRLVLGADALPLN